MQTMKALIFEGPKKFSVRQVPVPAPAEGEILVRVRFSGICGTDNRIYQGAKVIAAPRITGHEFAGEVAEVGKGVQNYTVGDRVTVYPMIPCGTCYACRSGRRNICVNRTTVGYEIDGGFAEYVVIPAASVAGGNVIKIPEGVTLEEAAISEPPAAALQGIKRARIVPGQRVVVIGAGPIGLYHIQLAKIAGASLVIASEPSALRRELALKLGADEVVDPMNQELVEVVLDATRNEGADAVLIDVAQDSVIIPALKLLRKGGVCVLFAGFPHGRTITFDPNLVHYKEIDLVGSSASTPEHQKEVLELVASGRMRLKETISDVFELEDWEKAFNMKGNFHGLKTIFRT